MSKYAKVTRSGLRTVFGCVSLILLAVGGVLGCTAETVPAEGRTVAPLGPPALSTDAYPEEYRVEFGVGSEGEPVINASGTHVMFPLALTPRVFDDSEQQHTWLAETLGASLIQTDEGWGAEGVIVIRDTPVYVDAEHEELYWVSDPVLAWLGGLTGQVEVGSELRCVDPDQECDGSLPSYLVPSSELTYPSHRSTCAENELVCADFHSFFNKTWFLGWQYASHGGNVNFTRRDMRLLLFFTVQFVPAGTPGARCFDAPFPHCLTFRPAPAPSNQPRLEVTSRLQMTSMGLHLWTESNSCADADRCEVKFFGSFEGGFQAIEPASDVLGNPVNIPYWADGVCSVARASYQGAFLRRRTGNATHVEANCPQ